MIRPAKTSCMPIHMTVSTLAKTRNIKVAVKTARTRMLARAAPNAPSTAPEKRLSTNPSLVKACMVRTAPSASVP